MVLTFLTSLHLSSESRSISQTPTMVRSKWPTIGERLRSTPRNGTIGSDMSPESLRFMRLPIISTEPPEKLWMTSPLDKSMLWKTLVNWLMPSLNGLNLQINAIPRLSLFAFKESQKVNLYGTRLNMLETTSITSAPTKPIADNCMIMRRDTMTDMKWDTPCTTSNTLCVTWNMRLDMTWSMRWKTKRTTPSKSWMISYQRQEKDTPPGAVTPNAPSMPPDTSGISWIWQNATAQLPLQSPETQEYSCNESRDPYQVLWTLVFEFNTI